MKHIGIVKPDILIRIINWVGIPLFFIYLVTMFVAPWVVGEFDWQHVQDVWHSWQPLNIGMLAFVSSLIAFNISIFNARKQRERTFVAAKAFLPESLSELIDYFESSASLLIEAWPRVNDKADRCKTHLSEKLPDLPVGYKEIFSRCIESAEPNVGEYLAYILMRLQIHNSRITELAGCFREDRKMIVVPQNIITYLYCLGELQALTNQIFEFARGLKEFDSSSLQWDDFSNAYRNLDIRIDEYDDLEGFTQRAIKRGSSNNHI